MAQEAYELQVLMDLREQARDEAQDLVAARVAELHQAQLVVKALEQKLRDAIQNRLSLREKYSREAATSGGLAGGLYQVSNYLRALEEDERQIEREIEGSKKNVISAQRSVDDARKQLVEAATELEAVISHHQQWAAEQRVLADRKQSAAMDDIAARIWRENQS